MSNRPGQERGRADTRFLLGRPGQDGSYEAHELRDGSRVFRFHAWRLAWESSGRAGAPRWSEIGIYRLLSGGYIVSKTGRSRVAHAPECPRVTWRMPTWLEAREEGRVARLPCLECLPFVGDGMDPHTRLEPSRYRVIQTAGAKELVTYLVEGREWASLPRLIRTVLDQASSLDEDVAKYCDALMLAP